MHHTFMHIMYLTSDTQAIATNELYCHLESQVNAIAPDHQPIIPADIQVVKVGTTRNASCTPYVVYKVNGRRCCTFIKRKLFHKLVKLLVKVHLDIIRPLRSITTNEWGGITVKIDLKTETIPSAHVNKFFTLYNQSAITTYELRITNCDCDRLFGFCQHDIATALQPRHEQPVDLSSYRLYGRGRASAIHNWRLHQQYKRAIASG